MTLDANMYHDPMLVLERKQEDVLRRQRACTGCIHRQRHEVLGEIVIVCSVKRTVARRICDFYKKENE